jgi:DNA-directed RNA polymerase omega subunit|nr:DNA-directed RNA polymerase subunit omega [Oxalobacteraceae bacterium]
MPDPINRNLTSEIARNRIGSQYDLVLVAAARLRQLRDGATPLVPPQYGDRSTALKEIEEGLVGLEILDQPYQPPSKTRGTK